jgi:hypothetical protein
MKPLCVLVLLGLVLAVECKEEEGETLLYKGIKIGFWWLLGVTIGVYFQARLNLREKTSRLIEVLLYGLFIGVTVYTLFVTGELVQEYF